MINKYIVYSIYATTSYACQFACYSVKYVFFVAIKDKYLKSFMNIPLLNLLFISFRYHIEHLQYAQLNPKTNNLIIFKKIQ